MAYEYNYASTVTKTETETSVPTVTVIVPTLSTKYYYHSTVTTTIPASVFETADATSTQTVESVCTATSYTATAASTTTQSAKCAPTNFATGLGSIANLDALDAKNLWQGESYANKDASTCCQACVEEEDCVAMDFYYATGCSLYLGSECGDKSIQVRNDLVSGAIGGTVGTVLNTPMDVVKSRIQNTTKVPGVAPKYNWAFPALGTVLKEEGFGALYKGFIPKVLRLGPGGGILLVVFTGVMDFFREMKGLN